MKKKILIISSSYRKGGNSDLLADSFLRGASASGHDAEKIRLGDLTVNFCKGCLACQKTQRCVISDDAVIIADKMKAADVLVFATPVYYYGMSGQLKTLLDRVNPLYTTDYSFREIYLLAAAAEEEEAAVSGTVTGIKGFADCYPKCKFVDTVFAGGVTEAGDILQKPSCLERAYNLGASLR